MSVMRRITIVLADDHPAERRAQRTLLETQPAFSVVGEAVDASDVAEVTGRLQPDVLIVDSRLSGGGGIEATRRVVRHLRTKVVVQSVRAEDERVLEALCHGVHAYVRKDSAAELIQAIREVVSGQLYLSPAFCDRAIDAYRRRAAPPALDPYDGLTVREREILHLAAEGLSDLDIGARLSIPPRSAAAHRSNVMRKLGLRGPAELVRYAVRRGILTADDGN